MVERFDSYCGNSHGSERNSVAGRFHLLLLAGLLVACAAAAPAWAQRPGGDTLRLTADDLVQRIGSSSPALVRQRLEVARAAAARKAHTFFPSLPELEYATESDLPFANEGDRSWEIGVTQEIELGGQYFLRSQAADLALRQAELETRAVELAVRSEGRSAFARLAAAEARLGLIDTMLLFARRLDTAAGRLLAAEEISELERNAVRIERTREEIERLSAHGDLLDARADIARLVAIPLRTVVTTALPASLPIGRSTLWIDTLRHLDSALDAGDERLLERRPDWQALDRASERIDAGRTLASRRWIPNLRVGLGYIEESGVIRGEDITPGNEAIRSGFGELRTDDRLFALRLGIGVPLPFGGLYDLGQGEIAMADVELEIIRAERAQLASRIRADLARAAGRLRVAAEAHALYTSTIAPLVARNLQLLERGYLAGELSATEVITQQQQYLRTAEARIDAEREYMEALADFQRATGE